MENDVCVRGHVNPPRTKHGCGLCRAENRKTPAARARMREYLREYRAAHPEKLKAAQARWRKANAAKVATKGRRANWKKYGIDCGAAEAALAAHNNGHCQICGTRKPGGAGGWHVDHSHDSKKVRGILCSNCNRGLGHFKDNTDVMRMAIAYLEAAQ